MHLCLFVSSSAATDRVSLALPPLAPQSHATVRFTHAELFSLY